MSETLNIAKTYLKDKHRHIRVMSTGDIVCDGEWYYSPRRVRGSSIWLSAKRLEQLKKRNAILLAVENGNVVEIPASEVNKDGDVVNGITVRVTSDTIRVEISRELRNKLTKISGDVGEAIRSLLDLYDRILQTPPVGLTNEALAFRACLAIAKYRPLPYIRLMRKLIDSDEIKVSELTDEERKVLRNLASNRIVFIDNRHDGEYAKLLCTFEVVEKPDVVNFKMIYNRDFCRIYCLRYEMCDIRHTNSDCWGFGFEVNYTPEEFKKKTPEELMAKWIGSCVLEF